MTLLPGMHRIMAAGRGRVNRNDADVLSQDRGGEAPTRGHRSAAIPAAAGLPGPRAARRRPRPTRRRSGRPGRAPGSPARPGPAGQGPDRLLGLVEGDAAEARPDRRQGDGRAHGCRRRRNDPSSCRPGHGWPHRAGWDAPAPEAVVRPAVLGPPDGSDRRRGPAARPIPTGKARVSYPPASHLVRVNGSAPPRPCQTGRIGGPCSSDALTLATRETTVVD